MGMNTEMQQLLQNFRQRFEAVAAANQKTLEDATKKYEEALAEAQSQLEQAMEGAGDGETAKPADQPEQAGPAAAWISAPDGERMMVINQEAVVMFMAIFDRMAAVAEELQKLSNKTRGA